MSAKITKIIKKIKLEGLINICKLVSLALIIECLLVPLSSAITLKTGDVSKTYGSAYSFIFGGTISTTNISYSVKGVSPIGLIAFILLILATIILLASFFYKKGKFSKSWFTFASFLLVLTASILFLTIHRNFASILASALTKSTSNAVQNTIFNNTTLNFGVWGVPFFGFIACFIFLVSLILDGSFDKLRVRLGLN